MHRIALITLAALLTTACASSKQEKSQVVKNCMRGRGYRVLN